MAAEAERCGRERCLAIAQDNARLLDAVDDKGDHAGRQARSGSGGAHRGGERDRLTEYAVAGPGDNRRGISLVHRLAETSEGAVAEAAVATVRRGNEMASHAQRRRGEGGLAVAERYWLLRASVDCVDDRPRGSARARSHYADRCGESHRLA